MARVGEGRQGSAAVVPEGPGPVSVAQDEARPASVSQVAVAREARRPAVVVRHGVVARVVSRPRLAAVAAAATSRQLVFEVRNNRVVYLRAHRRKPLVGPSGMHAVGEQHDVHVPFPINPQRRPGKSRVTNRGC